MGCSPRTAEADGQAGRLVDRQKAGRQAGRQVVRQVGGGASGLSRFGGFVPDTSRQVPVLKVWRIC